MYARLAIVHKTDKKKQRRKRSIICCDHVNKCLKHSRFISNAVANILKFSNESSFGLHEALGNKPHKLCS